MPRDQLRPAFDAPSLRDGVLGGGSRWRRLDVVAETGSTNSDLIARAAAGEDIDGAVLIAEQQTAGRGRHGRSWSAVSHAQIAISVGVAADAVPSEAWGWLPLATGVAVVDAISEAAPQAGVAVGLKWPNDVLAGPGGAAGKLAGILAEVAAPKPVIVVGIGLNVGDEEAAPDTSTSLVALGVERPDRDLLVRALLTNLGRRFDAWQQAGGADADLRADYLARSLTVGSRVRALLPGGSERVGIATSVDPQGRLQLETDGEIVAIAAGDIVHLRAV
jgi:BirA family biotin operon repressor/biotin-[acetyl-CoA-carboxylase] ligase